MSNLSQFYGGGGSAQLPLGIKSTAFYIDALVVGAGGGPSLTSPAATSAGGGRVVQVFNLLVQKGTSYNITVGLTPLGSANGGDSSFGSIIAQGGGTNGQPGGSGGGGRARTIFPTIGTYSVNDPLSVTNIISSGNDGGTNSIGGSTNGGGGGAGGPGGDAPSSTQGGNGGPGLISVIKGPGPYFYGAGTGGIGIINAGGSGQGAGGERTGTGGRSGVVIIAYPETFEPATVTGTIPDVFTGATATRAGYHVYEFFESGTITFN